MENTATYSINEAADMLKLSSKTIRRYIKAGKLQSIKVPTKFGEEYRITEIPETLKQEAAALAEAEAKMDIIPAEDAEPRLDAQQLYQDNIRMAAQLGAVSAQLSAANERIKQLEDHVKLLEAPKEVPVALPKVPWWKRLFGGK